MENYRVMILDGSSSYWPQFSNIVDAIKYFDEKAPTVRYATLYFHPKGFDDRYPGHRSEDRWILKEGGYDRAYHS